MAKMSLYAGEIDILLPGREKVSVDEGDLSVFGYHEPEIHDPNHSLILRFTMKVEGSGPYVAFQVQGYDDIDALRRYCEMTLEHFKNGHLE